MADRRKEMMREIPEMDMNPKVLVKQNHGEMEKTTANIEKVDPTVNTEEKDICPDPETGTEISQTIEASDETTVEEKETTIEEITEMITKLGQEKQ